MRQRTILNTILTVLVCLFAMAGTGNAKTIYVDSDAAGANDGSSWADAYNYLQDALMMASAGDEIRVAQGVYRPDEFVLSKRPNLGREETFQLKNGVTLKGGYAGFGEPDPNARDVELYETILSGDLDGNDVDVSDPCDLLNDPTRAENSYHVVTGSGADASSGIEGFIITGGNANGGYLIRQNNGGGMYNNGYLVGRTCPVVRNCTFTENTAASNGGGVSNPWLSSPAFYDCTFKMNAVNEYGGGMFAAYGSNAILMNCVFRENRSGRGSGISIWDCAPTLTNCVITRNWAVHGGGVATGASTATFTNCIFANNSASKQGGGMDSYESKPVLGNCTFTGNSALWGGGIYHESCELKSASFLINCLFTGNSAEKGGAIYNYIDTNPRMVNCTFTGNSALMGNTLACDSLDQWEPSEVQVTDCILWDGGNEVWNNDSSDIIIRYSNVQGGWPGEDNINLDPCFADPGYWDPNGTPADANDDFWVDGDYHLKSQGGRWDVNEGRWTIDDVTSPCIDAGDPMSPIGLEPFPNGGIINMGAYGGTAEASKSYFGKPPCETIVAGDINGDCAVDFKDFVVMALHWLGDG